MNILQYVEDHQKIIDQIKDLAPSIEKAAQKLVEAVRKGGKVLWMGNGGSAADAQHMAAELMGRFKIERPPIPSIALTVNTSVLTCLSNDYDYSIVFSRQLEALCQPHDVVIGISTSGNSKNVIKGIAMAKQKGAFTIGLAGCSGGELAQVVDLCLTISSTTTARIQEAHLFIEHILCEYLESAIYQEKHSSQQENVTA